MPAPIRFELTEVFTTALQTPEGTYTPRMIILRRSGVHATEEVKDLPGEFSTHGDALEAAETVAQHLRG